YILSPLSPPKTFFPVYRSKKKKIFSRASIPETACKEVTEVTSRILQKRLREAAVDKKKPAEAGREGPRSWRRGTEIVAIRRTAASRTMRRRRATPGLRRRPASPRRRR